jgi:hypothetical protein
MMDLNCQSDNLTKHLNTGTAECKKRQRLALRRQTLVTTKNHYDDGGNDNLTKHLKTDQTSKAGSAKAKLSTQMNLVVK